MGVGNKKITGHIDGFKEEIDMVSKKDLDLFFNWFNESGGDTDTNFIKGECEFTLYVLMPAMKLLKDLKNKVALEIGYGGGRLLAAASHSFKEVIGVDIHSKVNIVDTELRKRGIDNFKLLQNDGKSISINDSSIDLVYSFIVLQHVEKVEIFNNYLKETYRVLKPGGVAVLFFGRLFQISSDTESKTLYRLDRFLERFHSKGYQEIVAQVNCTNLKISLDYAKKKSKQEGFTILGQGVSKKLPNFTKYGGQLFLILKK